MGKNPAGPSPMWGRIVSFIAVFAILASLAIVMNGRLFGHDLASDKDKTQTQVVSHEGNPLEVNTTDIPKDIVGYAGPVPVKIYITDGRIDSLVPLPNAESEEFFGRLKSEGLTAKWDGLTLAQAADLQVDGVTGATYSSKAFIGNVQAGLRYAGSQQVAAGHSFDFGSVASCIALAVILSGAILPVFVHGKRFRLVQQVLNVAVLGFWAGTFIDYAMMINFFGNGFTYSIASLTIVALLIVGLIYPLTGRGGHYCAWICPFGSLQDLAGSVCRRKLRMSQGLVKGLDKFRHVLWVVLLLLLYAGFGTAWIDSEIFTAFIVSSASWVVITVGIVFVALSLFIPRPFCRFVCPTGTLLRDA